MNETVLKGRVEHGRAVGRTLGTPTLNFDAKPEGLDYGVYLGWTRLCVEENGDEGGALGEQKKYSSIAHWGPRPTFDEIEPLLEVHVLDFSDELYGKEVSFEFLKKIREVQSFENPEALKGQIQKDIRMAREFFARFT